jgi:hypothetical protein
MDIEVLYSIAAYGLPFVLLAVAPLRSARSACIVAASSAVATALGEVTYLACERGSMGVQVMLLQWDFWKTVAALYPMALIPLGLWVASLTAVQIALLRLVQSTWQTRSPVMLLFGVGVGVPAGSIFMLLFEWGAGIVAGDVVSIDSLAPFVAGGAVAGGFCGFVAGHQATADWRAASAPRKGPEDQ